ncbi:MAG TPA: hypothetical protein VMV18_03535, partial [bacterium]|nr:hypothetical protein [bacterium]
MSTAALAAQPPAAANVEKPDLAALEKLVADAPGPISCYQNTSGERLEKCENREKGLTAFKKLYEADKTRAIAALKRRFDEIPSPKGGYFPILAAAQVKDKEFVPMLKKVATSQKDNDLGLYATEAMRVIETGKCSKSPVPNKLREICE